MSSITAIWSKSIRTREYQLILSVQYLQREILEGIFQPLVANINELVKSQVDSVRIKRMEESHAKGKEIKVCKRSLKVKA